MSLRSPVVFLKTKANEGRGQCYDYDFLAIFGEKMAHFFLKTNVVIKFCA
jgi:hypothetical protein